MLADIVQADMLISEDPFSAEVVIINTCGFIEPAKAESIGVIQEAVNAKKHGPVRKVIVAGCLSERMGEELTQTIKGIDAIVKLVRSTREEPWDKELDQGASARAGLSLYEKVQTIALLEKRKAATVEDVKNMAISSMGSRVKPSPESKFYDDPLALIEEITDDILGG